jgi:hypothetical protein
MSHTNNRLSKIKRIIFFVEAQFSLRDYKRFGVEILEKNGYEVQIWDFTQLVNRKLFDEYTPSDIYDNSKISVISCEKTALVKINLLNESDLVISFFLNTYMKRNIFEALSKNNIFYGFNTQNSLPSTKIKYSLFLLKLFKLLINHNDLINSLYSKFQSLFVKINPPNFIMVSGSKTVNINNKLTDIIWTHKLDYDIYLNFIQNNNKLPVKPYILLLDEYIPFHPDGINEN